MAPAELKCEFSTCSWVSPKGELDTVVKLMEMHFTANHKQDKAVKVTSAKAEKAKRPEIAAEMSDEDWAYFLSRWSSYKKATSLEGDDINLQLMECCCEQLRKDHYRNFPNTATPASETTLLAQIKQIAVRAKNRAVNRFKLNTLHQDKGEPIRRFAGRIRGLAAVSEYSVQCTACNDPVSYTDEVIKDQVIAGIADLEIQKDVLSHPESKTFDLEKLLSFVEGKESGMTSQGLMSGNKVEANLETKPSPRKCKFCGDTHVLGKIHCKAAGKQCEKCGKKDHFAKVCRSSKKNEEIPKVEAAGTPGDAGPQQGGDRNWACGAVQPEEVDEEFQSFENTSHGFYQENKDTHYYSTCFNSRNYFKEVYKNNEKIGVTHPGPKRGNKNKKKAKKSGCQNRDEYGNSCTGLSHADWVSNSVILTFKPRPSLHGTSCRS